MSAFRREARNIIERDLPHIPHRDNIIRVWKDRSRDAHTFLAKTKPFVLFRHMPSFEFKYYFQVQKIHHFLSTYTMSILISIYIYSTVPCNKVCFNFKMVYPFLASIYTTSCELHCHIL